MRSTAKAFVSIPLLQTLSTGRYIITGSAVGIHVHETKGRCEASAATGIIPCTGTLHPDGSTINVAEVLALTSMEKK